MMRQTSPLPTAKVAFGTLAGAAVTLGIPIARKYGIELSVEQASAIVVIVTAVVSYFVPPSWRDIIVKTPE